ncbi:transcriptional regulator [Streptomyces cyaneochromogenes]|uniref:Transcriptional regulator n=1 Tax=Streptomyces cyaneochromogenes TaxID=2496836 RepID=A0A3S9MFN1_9ACTN|nr:helix-turn-helix domain-containing protein [Streptomyces cyaneochromogenes]AZQ37993.1 transcriptional regulator [Streptomyces cyaneochromogenes]
MKVRHELTHHQSARESDAFHTDCPGRHVLNHVTSRWGVLILSALREGDLRFYELRDRIGGISEKMLSQNLRVLCRDGLVSREVVPDSPPRVSYGLTPLGSGLAQYTHALVEWITLHTHDIVDAQTAYDAAADTSQK